MCLPGTVAAVREAIDAEGVSAAGIVSRRTVLAGSAVAALAALVPTGG